MQAEYRAAAAYEPREVATELRRDADARHGRFATTDETASGKELKVEYRAGILLDRQADRIELLEATLRSILPGEPSGLAAAALSYPADKVPNAVSTEDGDVAWVEVTPITETAEQALAALKANGLWTVMDDGAVSGYEVSHRVWMVPCVNSTERPLLTAETLLSVQHEDEIVYFEMDDQQGCETGAWWWHCDEAVFEPQAEGSS